MGFYDNREWWEKEVSELTDSELLDLYRSAQVSLDEMHPLTRLKEIILEKMSHTKEPPTSQRAPVKERCLYRVDDCENLGKECNTCAPSNLK